MQLIRVIYGRSYLPISLGIQLRTFCKWSHVAVVSEDGLSVIETRLGHGVVRTSMEDFKKRYVSTEIRWAWCLSVNRVFELGESLMGSEYDNDSFLGLLFSIYRDDPDAYQCAELTALLLGTFDPDRLASLVPKDILKMSFKDKPSMEEFSVPPLYAIKGHVNKAP